MRTLLPALITLLLLPSAAADVSTDIDTECGDAEPVISISDPQKLYSQPAEPGFYEKQLCISGITDASVQLNECKRNTGFYISGREGNSHFSIYEAYNLNVCTGEVATRLADEGDSCGENETALFSVSGSENGHVAAPGVFGRQVCGSYTSPSTVTLSMEFNLSSSDTVRFDGREVDGEQDFSTADYPYLISSGNEMIAGMVASDFMSASRSIDDGENVLSMRKSYDDSKFFLPFTSGEIDDIERREEMIEEDDFLQNTDPSFAFDMPSRKNVKVLYDPEFELKSNITYRSGETTFEIVKSGEEEIMIR